VFNDPQSVTYNAVAKSLPRTGSTGVQSDYRLVDSGGVVYTLTLSHQFSKRNRVVARLRRESTVTDPLVPANSIGASMTATLTIDFPVAGLTPTDAQLLAKALVGWGSDANLLKLAGGET
jgi:hypothetical protein